MITRESVEAILRSRGQLRPSWAWSTTDRGQEAEGGCGVIGIACSHQIAGRHLLQALDQMRNRGNGKGGGIAAVGLVAQQLGVSQAVLEEDYLLAIAYMDEITRSEVEQRYIQTTFDVDHVREAPHLPDYRSLAGLDVEPPAVVQYFVRVRQDQYEAFKQAYDLDLPRRRIEDEIVYQHSARLNGEFYASTGEKRAFVLSHGKNLLVMKMVGYGDDVVRYYRLEDLRAHVWIGHHRYPTKGRVWHPGGAHPFVGLNEALVHNGDFANYASISEYLAQRNIFPMFLTDTEVSVQVFDLLYRTYNYPLEYVIEALAPTTERDFAMLSPDRQHVYQMLQTTHIHASPDGPWFFLIAQSDAEMGSPVYRLTGITDTSMLRPQVFAWQQNRPEGPAIGLAASEKQAIDAALSSLAAEDKHFWSRADAYWNARGGSHTDGGAFIFSVFPRGREAAQLVCSDKFGNAVANIGTQPAYSRNGRVPSPMVIPEMVSRRLFEWATERLRGWSYEELLDFLSTLESGVDSPNGRRLALETITLLMDRRYNTGQLRPSVVRALLDESLERVVANAISKPSAGFAHSSAANDLPSAGAADLTIIVDGRGFAPEGPDSLALELVRLHALGFRRFIVVNTAGHRFLGSGLGPASDDVQLDVYGSPGDYLGSGIDGATIVLHNSGQDQLAQIMKSGKLVVFGDVGQTFLYGAKGGEAYVLGNAAGRPLINAVGKPRVVINGTCLDYLAESFMAGDPSNGGGFVIVNGLRVSDDGCLHELTTPYPGGNLFSLASGGAIFIRDPYQLVAPDQLNGGEIVTLSEDDWTLILPYLQENERLFGIAVSRLLEVGGQQCEPSRVYRKIRPARVRALQAEETWVTRHPVATSHK